ncbi:hypothetical protein EDC04DRAFT_2874695 [Pisolithus marmoratus]|nr:hypothetical protein EDC04DRAFT_2874695 [Pisolithus marmoratus]
MPCYLLQIWDVPQVSSETECTGCCLISGTIVTPFWVGFPLCCIHSCVTANVLHQLFQGIIKYLIALCVELINESELNCQLQTLPQCSGVHHFKDSWSKLLQVSRTERKQMAKVLLGCLVSKVPNDVLTCYKALLDFIYLAQYPSHDDDTLEYMEAALTLFHKHKEVFFHSLLHYVECIKQYGTTDNYNMEAFEHLHIDLAKEGWHASNTRNLIPQMMRWLDRQEKIAMIVLAKCPAVHAQPIWTIEELHSTPHFSKDLKCFLNSLLPPNKQLLVCSYSMLTWAYVGLNILDIWHSYKLQMDKLGNDVDVQEEMETTKAKPGDSSRFDTIVVVHSTAAESTGLQGVSI